MKIFREEHAPLVENKIVVDVEALKARYASNLEILAERSELRQTTHQEISYEVSEETMLAEQHSIEESLILCTLEKSSTLTNSDRLGILSFLEKTNKICYPAHIINGIYDPPPESTGYDGASPLIQAFLYKHMQVMEFFLRNKANPNHTVQSDTQKMPWFIWCFTKSNGWDDFQFYKLAHQYGANINAKTSDQKTLLMIAAEEGRGKIVEELIPWLLQNGADPNHVDLQGYSVLDHLLIVGSSRLVGCLLEHNAHSHLISTVDQLIDRLISLSSGLFPVINRSSLESIAPRAFETSVNLGGGIGSCLSDKHCSLLPMAFHPREQGYWSDNGDEGQRCRTEGKLFIGATYDRGILHGVKKITRFTPGFDKAITNLDELKEVFSAPEKNQETLACLQENFSSIKKSLENCIQKKEEQLIKITGSSSKEEIEQLNADLAILNDTLHFLAVELGHSPNGISISAMTCDPLISQVVGGRSAHSQSSYYKLALAMNQERAKNMMLSAISADRVDMVGKKEKENLSQNDITQSVDHLVEGTFVDIDELSESQFKIGNGKF